MQNTDIPSAESDAWNIAEAMSGGKSLLLRYRPGLKASLGDPRYPKILSITWRYAETNSSGMPTDAQTEEMRGFEDTLQSCLDADRAAILAFVRTGCGERTWYSYVSDLAEVEERINRALEAELPIELTANSDPDWQELRDVFASSGEAL